MTEFQENMQRIAAACKGKRGRVKEIAKRAGVSEQTVRDTLKQTQPERLTDGQRRVISAALDYLKPYLDEARDYERRITEALQ